MEQLLEVQDQVFERIESLQQEMNGKKSQMEKDKESIDEFQGKLKALDINSQEYRQLALKLNEQIRSYNQEIKYFDGCREQLKALKEQYNQNQDVI